MFIYPQGKGQTIAATNPRIRKTSKYYSPPIKSKKSSVKNLTFTKNFCELCFDYKKLAMSSVPNSTVF